MSKPEWGIKRLCPSCSALYYDFGKNPPICPKCSTAFDPEALLKSRRRGVAEEAKAAKKAATPAVEEVEDDIEVEEEVVVEDDASIEDADEEIEVDVDVDDKDA